MFYVNTKTSQQSQHNIGKNNFLVFFQICICILNQSVCIRNKVKLEDQKCKARFEGFSSVNDVQIQFFQSAINSCYTFNVVFDYTQTQTAAMTILYPIVQLQSALLFQNKTICLAVNTKELHKCIFLLYYPGNLIDHMKWLVCGSPRRKTEKEMAFNLASCYVYLYLMWD